MDDEVPVRVGDGGADLREKLEPLAHVESLARVAVLEEVPASMYSMTKYGRPSSVEPPSSSRAMFG